MQPTIAGVSGQFYLEPPTDQREMSASEHSVTVVPGADQQMDHLAARRISNCSCDCFVDVVASLSSLGMCIVFSSLAHSENNLKFKIPEIGAAVVFALIVLRYIYHGWRVRHPEARLPCFR